MNYLTKRLLFLLPLFWLMSCGDDDSSPSTLELIKANPWRVNNYDLKASSSGIAISDVLLAPFVDDILEQAPLNGTITFETDTFTIEDQGTSITGTWSLSADEKELTMVFTVAAQTFTFQILQITSNKFDLAYTVTQNLSISNNTVPVTLDITAFLVPA
ncbi:hypothetical protein QQ020_29115 [Fulvivirgaceae bacterium BMA12]|uniref:Lipoprotein n=1 Tax=Agaribacillus aureus TaxID=3051825 RepID=A0ABT8LEF5_9BACT|nr:hypothetical protein [Fulvivirgaceae bacterium BMA12]